MRRKSAWIAVILSFIFPGLGHAYLGRRKAALVFALPALVTTLAVILDVVTGPDAALAFVITPTGSLTTLALLLLIGLWRMIAIVDSVLIARRGGDPNVVIGYGAAAICLGLVVSMHGVPAYYAFNVFDAASQIFVNPGPDQTGSASPSASGPGATYSGSGAIPSFGYQATPFATPKDDNARVTILLTGIDSDPTRSESLTDTLLVVSVNPKDGSIAMVSIPRDLSRFQLSNGKTYMGKVNSLMVWAASHPDQFPDGPFPTLIKELSYLIGVPINYYAALNLDGFRRMIDLVGGVTVDNPKVINDPSYAWLDGTHGFYLGAGEVHLDGRTALAYVRSRKGVGDNDFTRARRQQQLLLALRAKLTTPSMLLKIPDILQVAKETVRTDLPTSEFERFINLAQHVDTKNVKSFVLGPPYAVNPPASTTGGTYMLVPDMARIKAWSVKLFGSDSAYSTGN